MALEAADGRPGGCADGTTHTNEAPGGAHFRLPAGILGPKVLLINELAGSGGDFFPWIFRQQNAGPLIGTRTWGGLVKSSLHYALVDGGALTAPDNAVFDPINRVWIGEIVGIAPDIEVRMDARSVAAGRDPQLEAGVREALRLLAEEPTITPVPPPYPRPPGGRDAAVGRGRLVLGGGGMKGVARAGASLRADERRWTDTKRRQPGRIGPDGGSVPA